MSGSSFPKVRPSVGIAVLITSKMRPYCVVLGKRKGSMGANLFQLPGGHLEFGETWEEAAMREVQEETGMQITNLKFCHVINTIVAEKNYHYITIFMKGETMNAESSEPENLEPDKCAVLEDVGASKGWQWVKWDEMPSADNLFWPLRDFCKSGKNPFAT